MEDKREQLQRDGYVILSQVVPAEQLDRLRLDIEAVVQRQRAADPAWDSTSQPRAQIAKFVDAETLGAVEFLLHDHTYGVSGRLLGCPDAAVAATAAEVLCNPEFTPGAPSPLEREVHVHVVVIRAPEKNTQLPVGISLHGRRFPSGSLYG